MGSKNSAPPPPDYTPIANASSQQAQYDFNLGQQQLDWAKQQYADNSQIANTVVNAALKTQAVNDQNAALLGGVAGHAGLFTTTGDLQKLVRMLMNGGELDGKRYIKATTIKRFLKRTDAPRALGWDLVTPGGKSSAGHRFSATSWGHLGFTGTSIWVDPEKDLAVILLSNRVWPTPENIKIRKFRPVLHDTVVECVEGKW